MTETLAVCGDWQIQRVTSLWGSVRYWLRRQGDLLLSLTPEEYAALRQAMTQEEA